MWVSDEHRRHGDADRPAQQRGRARSRSARARAASRSAPAASGWRCRSRTASSGSTPPPTRSPTPCASAAAPARVAIGAGAVWVTSRRGGTVTRIDPGTARVTRTVGVGHSPQGVAVADGAVWVAVQDAAPRRRGRRPRRGRVDRAPPAGPFGGTDPARIPRQTQTVRDLRAAAQLPRPAVPGRCAAAARRSPKRCRRSRDGGRTYTFRVRPASGSRRPPTRR